MLERVFNRKILIVIFCGCVIFFIVGPTRAFAGKKINVVFRYDDYSARSRTDIELKILDAFRKSKASITFGVIPFVVAGNVHDPLPQKLLPLTPAKCNILKDAFADGTLDIALHGYSHQTTNPQKMTEFSGVDYTNQLERLTKGKQFLETFIGAPVNTFIPPWNSYDSNTLHALEELGFRTVSGDRFGAGKDSSLNFLPCTCNLNQLRSALRVARSSYDTNPVIVVCFHQFSFRELDNNRGSVDYKEFCDLLSWLCSQKDVRLLSISEATSVIPDLSGGRLLLNKRYLSLTELMPPFPSLLKENKTQYIESNGIYLLEILVFLIYCFLLISLGIIFSFIPLCFLFSKHQLFIKIVCFISVAVSVILSIYIYHDLHVSLRGIVVSLCAAGGAIGACTCYIYVNRKKSTTLKS